MQRQSRSTIPVGREPLAQTAPFPRTDPYIQRDPVSTYIQNTTLSQSASLRTTHVLTHPHTRGEEQSSKDKEEKNSGKKCKQEEVHKLCENIDTLVPLYNKSL